MAPLHNYFPTSNYYNGYNQHCFNNTDEYSSQVGDYCYQGQYYNRIVPETDYQTDQDQVYISDTFNNNCVYNNVPIQDIYKDGNIPTHHGHHDWVCSINSSRRVYNSL